MTLVLNPSQAEAVEHEEGSAIIIAGAGTGKTRVITQRIIRLLEKNKCLPENILALTFTEKAAAEMQERVDLAMPLGFGEVKIRTFHAFCKEILGESGIEMGIDPDFKLMDQVAAWIFLRENLTKFKLDYFRPLGNPTKFIANLSSHFSRLKEEDISPETYTKYAESLNVDKIFNEMMMEWEEKEANKKRKSKKGPPIEEYKKEAVLIVKKEKELARAYQIYEDLLIQESKMDFGGLIYLVLDLFKKRPNILSEYQKRYQFIMVDEFQDTNFAQNELVEMLAKSHDNLMVVGDDDQAIYKFRGASLSNILQFEENHPDCKNIVLTENYRSAQSILDLAYESIQHNNPNRLETKLGIDKRLVSKAVNCEPRAVSLWQFEDDLSEAERIAEEILSLTNSELHTSSEYKRITIEEQHKDRHPERSAAESKDLVLPKKDINQQQNEKVQLGEIEPMAVEQAMSYEPRAANETNRTTNHQLQTTNYSDIALLVRSKATADIFLGEFDRKGIPYRFVGNRGLFLQPEVKDLISFLTVLASPHDNISLFGLMQSRYFDFKQIDLIKYLQTAKQKNVTLFEHLEEMYKEREGSESVDMFGVSEVPLGNGDFGFSEPQGELQTPQPPFQGGVATEQLTTNCKLQTTHSFISLLHTFIEKSQTMSVGQLLWDFLKEMSFEDHLQRIADEEGMAACQSFSGNVHEFFQKITSFEKQSEEKTVLAFIDYLKIQIEAGDDPKTAEASEDDAVQIMTIHASKGLEFKTVFVPALVHNKFPSINRREAIVLANDLVKETSISEDFHTEEERRLFYVAVTRAKEKLYLTYAKKYNGGSREWKRSGFISEIIESPQIEFKAFEQKADVLDDLDSKYAVQKITAEKKPQEDSLFNNYLSYTQINTYKRCPKLYHYRYLLKIPSEPSVAANFGSAVHDALKDFYREMKKKQQPPLQDALLLYLKKNWKSSGYRDQLEEKDYYAKAEEILMQFYESNKEKWVIPEKIEEAFRIKMYNEKGNFIMINGRIDRIDKLPDGTFEVIDYKTGQLSKFVEKGLKKDLQLSLYAIATREFMEMDSTIFSLYFLKDNEKVSANRSESVLIEAKKEIWNVVDKMKEGDYSATPSNMICKFCDYRKICAESVV